MKMLGRLASIVVMALLGLPGSLSAAPQMPATSSDVFQQLWNHADLPVSTGKAVRSWLWGPKPLARIAEPYAESPAATHPVVYYDKSRMEINDPSADPASPWYVTNGLLVVEMLTGRIQTGADRFEKRTPAAIPVAGDVMPGRESAPTYADIARAASLAPGANRATAATGKSATLAMAAGGVTATLSQADMETISVLPRYVQYEAVTGHNIPDVFWSFMNANGVIFDGSGYSTGRVFDSLQVMGYPLTEPYWVHASTAGKQSLVLVQAFQRRILTYSPANPPGWQIEMGNVGLQYYAWRYGTAPMTPPAPNADLTVRQLQPPGAFASRQYSGIHTALYSAVASTAEWTALWKKHTSLLDPPPPPPSVDFAQEFVLAAVWGDKPNSCYHLDVLHVKSDANTIRATVRQGVSGGACLTVITQPNDFIAVSRSALPPGEYDVAFVDEPGNTLGAAKLSLP